MMNTLTGLRIYGPIHRTALAAKLGRPADEVVDDLYDALKPQGLAAFDPETCTWDVTQAGRDLFDKQFEREPKPAVEPSSKWVCWPTRRRA
jgi:hypothetical protein